MLDVIAVCYTLVVLDRQNTVKKGETIKIGLFDEKRILLADTNEVGYGNYYDHIYGNSKKDNKKKKALQKKAEEYQKHLENFICEKLDNFGKYTTRDVNTIYLEPPKQELGQGYKIIYDGDYIDGSHCGMGKSESAWNSLNPEQSC